MVRRFFRIWNFLNFFELVVWIEFWFLRVFLLLFLFWFCVVVIVGFRRARERSQCGGEILLGNEELGLGYPGVGSSRA